MVKTGLNAKQNSGNNTLGVPVIGYIYTILNWKLSDVTRLDWKTNECI